MEVEKKIKNKKCEHKNNVQAGYPQRENVFRVCSIYTRHCYDCGNNYSALTGEIIEDDNLIPIYVIEASGL